jgi:hypothetical protein
MLGRSGLYFDGLDEAVAHEQAYEVEAGRRLWRLSEQWAELRHTPPGH